MRKREILNKKQREVSEMEYKGLPGVYNQFEGERVAGVLPAVIANRAMDSASGLMVAGIANIADRNFPSTLEGVMISGLTNESSNQKGVFVSSVNLSVNGTQRGVYVALITNSQIHDKDYFNGHDDDGEHHHFSGVSVAPINYCTHSRGGLQVGLVNIAKENEGPTIQVGLINRCGNRTVPGINVSGLGNLYNAVRERFKKKQKTEGGE